MAIQQFELLKKSAVTEIQADLEAAVLADRLLAESARDAAQLAQTAAETAETNAELAETNAELAETNAEAAKDLAVAAANAFPATNPQVAYHSRVLADSGVIKDLDRLTELYMNQLNLLPYTHFLWDGNAGYKVVNGKLVKAYDMSPNANDGTTSAGTEPYAGGLIAPNESVKIKALIAENRNIALTSEFLKSSSDRWSVTFVANIIKTGNISIIFGKNGFGFFGISSSGNFIFYNQSETLYAFSTSALPYINKNTTFSLIGFGSQIGLYINGNLVESKDCVASISISHILNYDNNANSGVYNFIGHIPYFQAITKSLSAYEIQLQHELLRLQHPEIEGIDIGNQHWATSNYEGVVTGNGTVIPEYKYTAANSPELVVNGGFDTDTDWDKGIEWSISGGTANCDGSQTGLSAIKQVASLTNGKYYKVTYTISNYSAGYIRYWQGGNTGGTAHTENGTFTQTLINDGGYILFEASEDFVGSIDNVSVKEAGWDELTTPAWCYYNNDASLGAVYGKLYNPYALLEIAKNPPMGWRVPLEADAIQLRDYLGGYSVAGGKCKVAGTDYWDNGGTNESGLSIIGVGARSATGIFDSLKNTGYIHCVRQNGAISWMQFLSADNTLTIVQEANMKQGMAIRLLRNSPTGEDTKIISTGRFATDISVSPKFIPIPFGHKVEAIVINTANSLTGVTAAFGYGSYTALFENKSMDANTTKTFIPNATEMTYLYQDGFVYVAANGNTDPGMEISVVLKKIQ